MQQILDGVVFDAVQAVIAAIQANINGFQIGLAFSGYTQLTSGLTTFGVDLFVFRREGTAVGALVVHMALVRSQITSAIVFAAAGHRGSIQHVVADHQATLAGVGQCGIIIITVD